MNPQLLCNQAVESHQRGNLAEAEQLYLRVLQAEPDSFTARHLLGVIRAQQGRNAEALELIGAALKTNPDAADALSNFGNVLKTVGRFEDAVASYDRTLAIKPDYAEAWYNRGGALQNLKRLEEALFSIDKALALKPDYADAWSSHGVTLQRLRRFEDALESIDKALALDPAYAAAWNNRGVTLQSLKRYGDAQASFEKALALKPDYARALYNLGAVLCESHRTEEGLAVFTRLARLLHATGGAARGDKPVAPHKERHDREQRDYLAGGKARDDDPQIDAMFHLEDGGRLATPAVNPANAAGDIAEQWQRNRPKIVVIDNFLTDEALDKLRRFCWGSTVWRVIYDAGYLGAMLENGFACPLLAQIADELRVAFPAIFAEHPLRYLWGFKYDSRLTGINVHADKAAVNVNFWITPDESNLDPAGGGLVIWDVAAPPDWDFSKYNGDVAASRDFLARTGARPVTVPYRANRAVIFDSDLFHETDKIKFKDGYLNRRINVTLLYGKRVSEEE